MINTNCLECGSRKLSIFSKCSPSTLQKVSSIKQGYTIKKGEDLFHEGKHPRGLFCVQNGKLKVSQIGKEGKEQIVHLIKNGDPMGHRALFDDEIYSCSAIAIDKSQLCFIPKSSFFNLLAEDHSLHTEVTRLLSRELKEAEQNITNTGQLSVEIRLINTLIKLCKSFGFEEDQITINVKMSRSDLANLVGTSRETVTRKLYQLEKKKLIRLHRKNIQISSLKALETTASIW